MHRLASLSRFSASRKDGSLPIQRGAAPPEPPARLPKSGRRVSAILVGSLASLSRFSASRKDGSLPVERGAAPSGRGIAALLFGRPVAAFVAGCALFAAAPAGATTGLAWQWEGQSRRYQIDADVSLPAPLTLASETNAQVRITRFQLHLLTTCAPTRAMGKAAWELKCTFDDVRLDVAAYDQMPADKVVAILDELDAKFLGGWAQIVFDADGHFKTFDLEGVSKDNDRIREIQETMRLVALRGFAPLDLELPPKGDDKERGGWTQAGGQAAGFVSAYGSMGQFLFEHAIAKTNGTVVTVKTSGHGTIGTGEMVAINGTEQPANLYDSAFDGWANFDTATGELVGRAYTFTGTPTASAINSEGGQGRPYLQDVHLAKVKPGETPQGLGPNGVFTE